MTEAEKMAARQACDCWRNGMDPGDHFLDCPLYQVQGKETDRRRPARVLDAEVPPLEPRYVQIGRGIMRQLGRDELLAPDAAGPWPVVSTADRIRALERRQADVEMYVVGGLLVLFLLFLLSRR